MIAIIILAVVLLTAVAAVSLRTKESEAAQPPVAAFAELVPTGDDKLDKLCADMWQKEDYQGIASLILTQIAVTNDWDLTPEQAQQLRAMRRNELLAEVLDQATSVDITDLVVVLQGLDVDDQGCRYNDKPLALPLKAYLLEPDQMPCKDCPAKGRKFFCGIIMRPAK